ncbi:exodeoxyribonuclease VII small subunit [Cupriavidus necator]|uniref:Exodeoxyribonuclease 7 small subunit n=1 Tax=Cupriavidus necator (strain ATCC 17699 / DSM 428 / KCTC 22496 / NCIMB 10442 / H16 / Stanier 337) TaxID=381666 RepID=Q0K858_CUPNH|nr:MULTISPECIES: exodeoxyribonuclease VII small subunit [Cupriavidus]EON17076.1 exodeoxyribonuclease VII small subunit [Cupriavidus sp. GA3-3]EYS97816.1 exodeoxyribonuclease VII small subunit [Cupriavidus sp. SK-4]KUE90467.1 exodeoxyribonuclease VII small subunit [Cupriavidus necator]QCC01591.1 exodeoxyribonuclease VII small subunit [Cupriavidus necator H16]QQB75577.1 exodeoxyribonuclease VII small subunit [Cupriavidus necator]
MPKTTTAPVQTDNTADTSASAPPASYEAAMAELETLVASMESGELPLEASLAAYRRGAELVRYCQQKLERVEQQVRVLEGDVLKPLAGEGNGANGALGADEA